MNKIKFFQDLEEIVVDPLFIGDCEDDIDREIANNTWESSISNELGAQLRVKDFVDFLVRLFPTYVDKLKYLLINWICFFMYGSIGRLHN